MTDKAPERIWALSDRRKHWQDTPPRDGLHDGHWQPYARADLLTAHEATIAALVEAIEGRLHSEDCDCGACLPLRAALAAAKGVT